MKMKKSISIFMIVFSCISCINKKALKEVEYKGIITKIYQDPMQHNMYFFDIYTEYGDAGVTASLWPYSWEYASVGDSIIKPPDTLMIIIKKPDGSSKEFFYR
jgi:hypothetical protein